MGARIAVDSLDQALDRCRNGEPSGFDAVYREFGRTLYGTARRMLSRPEDAEDAMQDTFLAFCRKLPDLPATQVGAWLHRVLVNRCIDRVRRGKRWREGELEDWSMPTERPTSGLQIDIDRAVAGLPEQARLIFVLHDVEGFKHREIATMLELSEGTTKSQLFRARGLLRERIQGRAPRGKR